MISVSRNLSYLQWVELNAQNCVFLIMYCNVPATVIATSAVYTNGKVVLISVKYTVRVTLTALNGLTLCHNAKLVTGYLSL